MGKGRAKGGEPEGEVEVIDSNDDEPAADDANFTDSGFSAASDRSLGSPGNQVCKVDALSDTPPPPRESPEQDESRLPTSEGN